MPQADPCGRDAPSKALANPVGEGSTPPSMAGLRSCAKGADRHQHRGTGTNKHHDNQPRITLNATWCGLTGSTPACLTGSVAGVPSATLNSEGSSRLASRVLIHIAHDVLAKT